MVVESGATDTTAATPNSMIATGAWYFLAGWYDHTVGAHGTVYVQINNGTTYSTALSAAKGNGARYVAIGDLGHADVAFGDFDGGVDEVGIWNTALTADQRTALYNAGNGLAYAQFTT